MRALLLGAAALVLPLAASAADFSVGAPVEDRSGTVIGHIAEVRTDATGKQVVVIRRGLGEFQTSSGQLEAAGDGARIDMTASQIDEEVKAAGRAGDSPPEPFPGVPTGPGASGPLGEHQPTPGAADGSSGPRS